MVIVNCLWVGALAGLVGSRLIRVGRESAAVPSCIAVGVLGALFGGLVGIRLSAAGLGRELPYVDIAAAAVAAALALFAWAAAHRLWVDRRGAGDA